MTVIEAMDFIEDGWMLTHKSWGNTETIKRCLLKTNGVSKVYLVKDGRNGELEMNLSGEDIDLFFNNVQKLGKGYTNLDSLVKDLNQE